MPVNISEDELRLALSPYRVDPAQFETAVQNRVNAGVEQTMDPLAHLPPLLRSAASLLPIELFMGQQASQTAIQSASIAGVLSKLLGYVAFPAVSVFVLLGSAVFGIAEIRRFQNSDASEGTDGSTADVRRWWLNHRLGAWVLAGATVAMALYGATWLMFTGYIVSMLILVYVLKSFAKVGIGNRLVVGQSCILGLLLLGQTAGFAGIGDQEIHLIDPTLLVPLFFAGAAATFFVMAWGSKRPLRLRRTITFCVITLGISVYILQPIFRPPTLARIETYVASFDRAEFSSASWRQWEIVASWALEKNAALDLSRPRALLEQEIADPQNVVLPIILGNAFRAGLVEADQVLRMADYKAQLRRLLEPPASLPLYALDVNEWIIRAAVLRHDLTPQQQDYLAARLHATLRSFLTRPNPGNLQEPLLATQLLEILDHPVDPTEYREGMQARLMEFHSKTGRKFQRAGGFKAYESLSVGELEATADAVQLMETYGIPRDLDVDEVRSFLRPSFSAFAPQKWIASVTLTRLNGLPGVAHPSWLKVIYYGRSFVAGLILIGLCIYATVISPKPSDEFEWP